MSRLLGTIDRMPTFTELNKQADQSVAESLAKGDQTPATARLVTGLSMAAMGGIMMLQSASRVFSSEDRRMDQLNRASADKEIHSGTILGAKMLLVSARPFASAAAHGIASLFKK